MKYIIIVVQLFLFSCTIKNHNENQNGNTWFVDSDKFDLFFKKFASDSLFQINSIKFPLDFEYYEDYDDEMTIIKIDLESWHYIDFSDDSLASDYLVDAYSILFERKDENKIEYIRKGIDNGINVIYHFEILEGQWFLVKITDRSS